MLSDTDTDTLCCSWVFLIFPIIYTKSQAASCLLCAMGFFFYVPNLFAALPTMSVELENSHGPCVISLTEEFLHFWHLKSWVKVTEGGREACLSHIFTDDAEELWKIVFIKESRDRIWCTTGTPKILVLNLKFLMSSNICLRLFSEIGANSVATRWCRVEIAKYLNSVATL